MTTRSCVSMDLYRDCAAPLTKYRVTKENGHGQTSKRGVPSGSSRVALTSGLPRKQVAKDFGVGFSTLNSWIQQDRRNPEKPTAQTDMERELAELRRENRQLREEREVLKNCSGPLPACARYKQPVLCCA